MEEYKFTVKEDESGKRLDAFLKEIFDDSSRTFLQGLITKGEVTVNEKAAKANYKVRCNDEIYVNIPEPVSMEILPEEMDLDIVYEDADVLVVNKPAGLVVHPAHGHYSGTLVNGLLAHCHDLSGINGVLRPGIVHRIDKDTSGLLMIAKNDEAHQSLAAQLKEHSVKRAYYALTHGVIAEPEGLVDAPIGRHPTDRKKMSIHSKQGRDAITHYRVLERFGAYTFIECRLETGRTHQIRVHMASIGHPLLGDEVYGPARQPFSLEGQTLHAGVLGFIHPRTGEYVEFSAPLPAYFEELLEKLRKKAGK